MTDPYGTAGIRERVLAAWTASPARFREDANAEEDYALGGYRDRVVVELAQNAADAARRAGVPGRLRFILAGTVLTAANTGVPLDAAGVEALSTLRASTKRDDAGATGRLGVGFAAVAAVSDEPSISTKGMPEVAWSALRTRRLVAAIPELATELRLREGRVPILRLPFEPSEFELSEFDRSEPDARIATEGFDTVVRLPLRDVEAVELVRRQLVEAGPALMLALPALRTVEIDIDGTLRTLTAEYDAVVVPESASEHEVTSRQEVAAAQEAGYEVPGEPEAGYDPLAEPEQDVTAEHETIAGDALTSARDVAAEHDAYLRRVTINGRVWRTVEDHGMLDATLLADRPTEERNRPQWWVRWAIPETAAEPDPLGGARVGLPDGVPSVVHAPTPGDERIGFPALLLASFPLSPDRRHVAPGPLTDFLIERAADAYLELLRAEAATPRLLDLVPGPVAVGELDARLRRAILRRLPELPLRNAVVVDGSAALLELLSEVLPGLLPVGWPVRHPALGPLGVRRLELADVIDALAGLDKEPGWWRRLYEALSGADPESLGALPVPLADDDARYGGPRLVRGARGLLIGDDGVDPAALRVLELRFVHPDAVHPLLIRLGAVQAGPRAVLADPALRAAVAGSFDSEQTETLAEAVLSLAAAAHLRPGEEPWLAELALPAADGDWYPAGELLLPDAPLAAVVASDAPFGTVAPELRERFGDEVLEAAGVLRTFAVVRAEDVSLETFAADLDDEEAWVRDVLRRLPDLGLPPLVAEIVAVRDLDLVENWEAALKLLARPPLRAALVEPAQLLLADGRRVAVPSYTAWWLRRHPVVDGRRPDELHAAEADPLLTELYDPAPAGLDPELVRALGVRTSLTELLEEPGGADELLNRLADPGRKISRPTLRALWAALAVAVDLGDVASPERVRAMVGGEPEVVLAQDALVLDRPDLLALLVGQPLVIGPYDLAAHLAELLDLTVASEEVSGAIESQGTERPVPPVVFEVLPDAPPTYVEHDRLVVDGQPVPWWSQEDTGTVHVSANEVPGLARGLAWAAGPRHGARWQDRLLVEAVLWDPGALPILLAEADLNFRPPA